MSETPTLPDPHRVTITATGDRVPLPFLIPDSLTIDGHEVSHLVQAAGWELAAGPNGEAILALRVAPDAVTFTEHGVVLLDGHPLCWPQGFEPWNEHDPPLTGDEAEDAASVLVAVIVYAHVAEVTVGRQPETQTDPD